MSEPAIITDDQLRAALARVSVGQNKILNWAWRFEFSRMASKSPPTIPGDVYRHGWLLHASFERRDADTGLFGRGRGRDFLIWEGTTLTGVIKTAWLAAKLVVEHELMHAFWFDGVPLFEPHATVDALHTLAAAHVKDPDTYRLWSRTDPISPHTDDVC